MSRPNFGFHAFPVTLDVDASGTEVAYVDFAKLVQRYTRLFAQADAREALQYLYLICLNADAPQPAGSEQVHKCHDLIRSLVLETRQYFELLGDIRNDGTKTVSIAPLHS